MIKLNPQETFLNMFRDMKDNNGGVPEDFIDWIDGGSNGKYSPFGDVMGQTEADEKSGEIDGELEVLIMAIQNLEVDDSVKKYADCEKLLLESKPKIGEPKDIVKLERRLQQIEGSQPCSEAKRNGETTADTQEEAKNL